MEPPVYEKYVTSGQIESGSGTDRNSRVEWYSAFLRFYRFNSEKLSVWEPTRLSFSFLFLITDTLKRNICSEICKYSIFLLLQSTFANILIYFYAPKMGKIDFDLVKFLFLVSLHFLLLNKSKNTFPPGTGSANVFKLMFFECPFWGNSQHFLRPCANLKSNHSK